MNKGSGALPLVLRDFRSTVCGAHMVQHAFFERKWGVGVGLGRYGEGGI